MKATSLNESLCIKPTQDCFNLISYWEHRRSWMTYTRFKGMSFFKAIRTEEAARSLVWKKNTTAKSSFAQIASTSITGSFPVSPRFASAVVAANTSDFGLKQCLKTLKFRCSTGLELFILRCPASEVFQLWNYKDTWRWGPIGQPWGC